MHELTIAQNVVDSVLSETAKHGARKVLRIELSVGELMQLDHEAFKSSLRILMTGSALSESRLVVKIEKAAFVCRKCSRLWDMSEAKKQLRQVGKELLIDEPDSKELPLHFLPQLYSAFVRCPKCGSADISLREGEDIKINKLVLE